MSQENVEVVRILFDQWGTDEWKRHVAEDAVWDTTQISFAGLSGLYEGHTGIQDFFRDWLSPWTDPEVRLIETIDAGDSVFTVMNWRARGRGSGAEVERDFFGVYDLRDGVIIRFRQYDTREEALATTGLGTEPPPGRS